MVPRGHRVQVAQPGVLQKLPAGHVVQEEVEEEYFPASQSAHEGDAELGATLPPAQVVQVVDPATEEDPALQLVHDVEPALAEYVPAAQGRQLLCWLRLWY
jgi:hypothetical protein